MLSYNPQRQFNTNHCENISTQYLSYKQPLLIGLNGKDDVLDQSEEIKVR